MQKDVLENTLESIKVTYTERLNEKDRVLVEQRENNRAMKVEINKTKTEIQTLKAANKNITQSMMEKELKLSQLQDETLKNQLNLEKSFYEIHLKDLAIQKLVTSKRL